MNIVTNIAFGSLLIASTFSAFDKIAGVLDSANFAGIWKKIKDIFSAKPAEVMLDRKSYETSVNYLCKELNDYVKDLFDGTPEKNGQKGFKDKAERLCQEVISDFRTNTDKHWNTRPGLSIDKLKTAAEKAKNCFKSYLETMAVLQNGLSNRLSIENFSLEYFFRKSQHYTVQRNPTKSIENLVLRGGQKDCASTLAAIDAMNKIGMLADLKTVVGAEGGSLAAIGFSFGLAEHELQKLCELENFFVKRRGVDGFAAKYPGMLIGAYYSSGVDACVFDSGFLGKKIIETLDHITAETVAMYLQKHWNKVTESTDALSSSELERLEKLKVSGSNCQSYYGNRMDFMITFADLAILHKVDARRFKNLVLTGHDMNSRETIYFSKQEHAADGSISPSSNMPIAYAGRISQGSSLLFSPVNTWMQGLRCFHGASEHGAVGFINNGLSDAELESAKKKTLLLLAEDNCVKYPGRYGSNEFVAKAQIVDECNLYNGLNVLPILEGVKGADDQALQIHMNTLAYIRDMYGRLNCYVDDNW